MNRCHEIPVQFCEMKGEIHHQFVWEMGHKDVTNCVDMDRGVGWQLNITQKILKSDSWIMISLLRSLDHFFFLFTDVYVAYNDGTKSILAIFKLIFEFILLLS